MAQFNFTVDTEPMAASVDGISHRLTATTAAVTAMEAAVIASEAKAANDICDKVDKGFYSLINSQISSKLAKHFTDMSVKLALILEYAKSLKATQSRMEADYHRIRREYLKIFRSLDKALDNRVSQLDKDAIILGSTRKKIIIDRLLHEAAGAAFSSSEISRTKQAAVFARIKSRTSRALDHVADRIQEKNDYGLQMDSILEKSSNQETRAEYVPVIYTEEQSTVLQGTSVRQTLCPSGLSPSVKNSIEMEIANRINRDLPLNNTQFENNEVYKEYNNMVASAALDPRIKQMMMSLYTNGGRQ